MNRPARSFLTHTIQIKLKIKIKGERLPSQPNLLNRLSGENLIPSFVALMNPPFVFFIFHFLYFILTPYRVSTRRQVHYLQSKIKDSNPLATQILDPISSESLRPLVFGAHTF